MNTRPMPLANGSTSGLWKWPIHTSLNEGSTPELQLLHFFKIAKAGVPPKLFIWSPWTSSER